MTEDRTCAFADRRYAWLGERLPAMAISFEFFPPRTPAAAAAFWPAVDRLARLQPRYVSVTCGASGNPAEGTAPLVAQLRQQAGLQTAAHLTCAAAPRPVIDEIARSYWQTGVRQIVALRGDRPKDQPAAPPDHHAFAADLVAALRRIGAFEIAVAAYPEPHPEAASAAADLDNLARKVDAGADRAITQYCFETETILRFRDRMAMRGIDVPLAVGILPVHNFAQVARFSARCGASVPAWLGALFEGLDHDPEQVGLVAASVAAEQARRLVVEGISELHFYTLNRADLTLATCRLLGLKPQLAAAA
jgi:methylenetetrahydrofolate reductase (NADPH)